jgi:prophage tail gpP-like protein
VEGRRTHAQIADTSRFRADTVRSPSAIVQQQKIDALKTTASTSTSTVVVQTLKVELGTKWIDAIERELKLVGLFLWCDAEGNFILARPNANQTPSFRIFRQRESESLTTNIVDCEFDDDATSRHTRAVVYGRVGKGKAGRNKLRGEFADDELADSEFDVPITIHDKEIGTNEQAKYIARKAIAEEHRSGWKLQYTIRGHITDLISSADGASTNWTIDTVVATDDRELGIQKDLYLEALVFSRAPTKTEIVLMRPEDLLFAEDLFPKPIVVQRQLPAKPNSGVDSPSTNE